MRKPDHSPFRESMARCTNEYAVPGFNPEMSMLSPDLTKRLKHLEQENRRLKQLVAELTLDKAILAEASRGNY